MATDAKPLTASASLFPELRLALLVFHAQCWAERYPIVMAVRLHRFAPFNSVGDFQYGLVFRVVSEKKGEGGGVGEACRQLVDDYTSGVLMPRSFVNVYRQEPGWEFRRDWWMEVQQEGDNLPAYLSTESVLLFSRPVDAEVDEEQPVVEQGESAPAETGAAGGASFVRRGEYWDVSFAGVSARLQDRKRLHYLLHLLSSPGQEINNLDLVRAVNKTDWLGQQLVRPVRKGRQDAEEHNEDGTEDGIDGESEMPLERTSTAKIRRALEEEHKACRQEGAEAARDGDPLLILEAKERSDRLRKTAAMYGLRMTADGRAMALITVLSREAEAARKNVFANLHHVRADLEKCIPSLARHIGESVKTRQGGAKYDPNVRVEWIITW
jgi:hypothetical protein